MPVGYEKKRANGWLQMNEPQAVSLNILVVDDDSINRRMMEVVLAPQGHAVAFASNGLEALDAVKNKKYDIVFMDLQMPVMDGIESSRLIRESERKNGYSTFIVALTASYLPEKGQELFDAGIDNYIAKPFKVEQIFRMVSYCVSGLHHEKPLRLTVESRETTATNILDVQAGLQRLGGNKNIYSVLLRDFIRELPERMDMLQQCLTFDDLHRLSLAAHNLIGVSASLGALQLSEYAKKLENQSNAGYTSSAQDLLQEIRTSGHKLIQAGLDFLSTDASTTD